MPADPEQQIVEDQARPEGEEIQAGQTYSTMVWKQFKRNRPSMIGLGAIFALALVAIFADFWGNHFSWNKSDICLYSPF